MNNLTTILINVALITIILSDIIETIIINKMCKEIEKEAEFDEAIDKLVGDK